MYNNEIEENRKSKERVDCDGSKDLIIYTSCVKVILMLSKRADERLPRIEASLPPLIGHVG